MRVKESTRSRAARLTLTLLFGALLSAAVAGQRTSAEPNTLALDSIEFFSTR